MLLCEVRGCAFGSCNETDGTCLCSSGWSQTLELDLENSQQDIQLSKCDYLPWAMSLLYTMALAVHIGLVLFLCCTIKSKEAFRKSVVVLGAFLLGAFSSAYRIIMQGNVSLDNDPVFAISFINTMSLYIFVVIGVFRRYLSYLAATAELFCISKNTSWGHFLVMKLTGPFGAAMVTFLLFNGCIPTLSFVDELETRAFMVRISLYWIALILIIINILALRVFSEVISSLETASDLNQDKLDVANKIASKQRDCKRLRNWIVFLTLTNTSFVLIFVLFGDLSIVKYVPPIFLNAFAIVLGINTYLEWRHGRRRSRMKSKVYAKFDQNIASGPILASEQQGTK